MNSINLNKWALALLFSSSAVIADTETTSNEVSIQKISTGNRYQAIAFDNNDNIWISGTNASVAFSKDNGRTWIPINAPGSDQKLQFRDIEYSNGSMVLMAAGEGVNSKVYRLPSINTNSDASQITEAEFQLESTGTNDSIFYDCLTTSQGKEWLYGDSINGKFYVLKKSISENEWHRVNLPFAADKKEGGFASSGTCAVADQGLLAFGTGNNTYPRLLLKDPDDNWKSIRSPFVGGPSAGIFSLVISGDDIYAFGGSLRKEHQERSAEGFVYDLASNSWRVLPTLPLKGAVYGSAQRGQFIYISNPQGVAKFDKNTKLWEKFSSADIWALNCHQEQCFGVGANDTVMKF